MLKKTFVVQISLKRDFILTCCLVHFLRFSNLYIKYHVLISSLTICFLAMFLVSGQSAEMEKKNKQMRAKTAAKALAKQPSIDLNKAPEIVSNNNSSGDKDGSHVEAIEVVQSRKRSRSDMDLTAESINKLQEQLEMERQLKMKVEAELADVKLKKDSLEKTLIEANSSIEKLKKEVARAQQSEEEAHEVWYAEGLKDRLLKVRSIVGAKYTDFLLKDEIDPIKDIGEES